MVKVSEIIEQLLNHRKEFERLYKCLNKRKQPKADTAELHLQNICVEYEQIVQIYDQFNQFLINENQLLLLKILTKSHKQLVKIYAVYKPEVQIKDLNLPKTKSEQEKSESEKEDTESEQSLSDEELKQDSKMPQEKTDILRLFAQTINKNYSGDPIGLNAFINSITLLEGVTEAANVDTLKNFIMTKVEGKALEAIPINPASIEVIKEALKNAIKPDNSKIIESRILSLRNSGISSEDFSKKAEELSDALKRTLIVEGISQEKANAMAVEKTVEMCRANARSNLVRSVLASSKFEDSKSVIAKFLVESSNDIKEKQVLNFNAYRNSNRFSTYPQKSFSNSGQFYNRYRKNFHSNPGKNDRQSFQTDRKQFTNKFQTDSKNKKFGNYNRRANVRVTETENSETPQSLNLGELSIQSN